MSPPEKKDRTRGAQSNIPNRFASTDVEVGAGDWEFPEWVTDPGSRLLTEIIPMRSRSAISRNRSPDIPFNQSINPYQGCEHGCVYCFARTSHSFHDMSPGLDFESRIIVRPNLPDELRRELASPRYRVEPLALGPNTDAWQPVEKDQGITRAILELMVETRHPCVAITKGQLVLRDIDLLAELAEQGLLRLMVSLTSLRNESKRTLEPRAAGPSARLRMIETLANAGVPVGVLVAPVIPAINDDELESILSAARDAGATRAGWILLRLPHEVAPLFRAWLDANHPQRAAHIMSLVQQTRGGKDYDSDFAQRQRGSGEIARLLDQRFRVACRKLGLNDQSYRVDDLRTDLFQAPQQVPRKVTDSRQGTLF